jgi:hypothetical protein
MAGYLDQYGAGEERREKIIKRVFKRRGGDGPCGRGSILSVQELPPGALGQGILHPAGQANTLLYQAGTHVFIEQQNAIKTITDRCGNGCPDTTHLDNYSTSTQCSGLSSSPNSRTFDLFTDTSQ